MIKFPYYFIKRNKESSAKKNVDIFHHILAKDRYDVAFDITWQTLTPTALNPCNAPGPEVCDHGMVGYNKRWLMVDSCLAISPFTVKSAIASGFANLLGGCYRVISKEVGHNNGLEEGQYPYGGGYKRYRIGRDRSKPAIVRSMVSNSDGSRTYMLMPVEEYYLDGDLPASLRSSLRLGDTTYVTIGQNRDRDRKPSILNNDIGSSKTKPQEMEVIYSGLYSSGRDGAPPHPRHKHRFYKMKANASELTCTMKKENFYSRSQLKNIVHLGPNNWYSGLDGISDKAGQNFVYYEELKVKGDITYHIGKNFQFKALFYHSDTVPNGQEQCTDLNILCPRCAMFGMSDNTEHQKQSAIGFKSRFKASTLVNDIPIEEKPFERPFRFLGNGRVKLKKWMSAGNQIARQELLPIQGPPKPNKKEAQNGYFDRQTGKIEGVKTSRHGALQTADNIQDVDNINEGYTHRLRNYAMVCNKNIEFKGTVGAENCSADEVAAFISLLHEPVAHHGFKVGLGKSFDMGSIASRIGNIWLRTNSGKGDQYVWKKLAIDALPKDITDAMEKLHEVHEKVNSLINRENVESRFPDDLKNYYSVYR